MNRPMIKMDDPKEAALFAEFLDNVVRNNVEMIMHTHRISPISVLAMLHQATMRGLVSIGGPAANDYSAILVQQFQAGEVTDDLREQQHEAFKRMVAHTDLILAQPEGRA